MPVQVRSFAKINIGLCIGPRRPDGFHELRTVYQTIGLHDVIRVSVGRGTGIEIGCKDECVPTDDKNTCYRIAERAMAALGVSGKVSIGIDKRLPVQGGLGGASSNAVAALVALERALKKQLSGAERLRIAAEVGSDLPLFLVGGMVLGVGRGEDVYPLPDLPSTPCVVATPGIGVSTPQAFADWDELIEHGFPSSPEDELRSPAPFDSAQGRQARAPGPRWTGESHGFASTSTNREETADCSRPQVRGPKLTVSSHSDRMNEFSRRLSSWLSGLPSKIGKPVTGVPAGGRGRAESPLLDLVRTGIENDFERVVFPEHPELREVKRVLEDARAFYASLSGSGSAVYGFFRTQSLAEKAVERLRKQGVPAQATMTMTRQQYWKNF